MEDEAADLERFFRRIPSDKRYHLELRTEAYLAPAVFDVLQRLGVGPVLSHWTWLPPLAEQFESAGRRFFNEGGELLIRLVTPHGMRFEDSYAKAFPFDRLVEGMLSERKLDDAAAIVREAVGQGLHATVIVNNSAGGNAPLIAEELSKRLASQPRREDRTAARRARCNALVPDTVLSRRHLFVLLLQAGSPSPTAQQPGIVDEDA